MGLDEDALRTAFNRVADSIERTALENPVNAWMRKVSRDALVAVFPAGSSLLEIGCGTGADAVFLAERGFRVAALDVSDRMVELARERAMRRNVTSTVVVVRGRLFDVAPELGSLPWAPFDGAYANFSLTYEASLRALAEVVGPLLKHGAKFLFTVPNKLCLSEPILSLARGHPRGALDRFREPRWASIRERRIQVHAYTTAGVRRSLAGVFEVVAVRGVPVFMPPPSRYHPAMEGLRQPLEKLDDWLSGGFPWRYLGDTTLFKARKIAE
jgi:SAM-dependent methyltransferase